MRVILLNTGTELLLGDVQDAHLPFIARAILPLGLRIEERRNVPDSDAIRQTLAELLPRCEILFVTGGLGPTTDDITREMVAELLALELRQSSELLASLRQRLRMRGIKWTPGIARQADVHAGAEVLPNQNGSAPGLYLRANINPRIQSPHLFLLPGPPRELQPMFWAFVMPTLRSLVPDSAWIERRLYKIADKGESLVEEAIGGRVLAIPGVELGYCARPGEVDVRIVGKAKGIEQADAIITSTLGPSIFSAADETLEEVIVKLLAQRNQTLSVAESCHGRIACQSHHKCTWRIGRFSSRLCLLRKPGEDRYAGRRPAIDRQARCRERASRACTGRACARVCEIRLCARYDGRCRTGRRLAGETGRDSLYCSRCVGRNDREEVVFSNRPRDL